MVREDRSKNLLSHKSLLILIKYIPHIIAIAYAIYTFLGIFGIDYNVFGCFFHVSFLTWIILYCLSIVFKYCYVHRLPIYYIGANELITCLDYYLDIELDYFTFITISLLMSCTLIFGYTYYYINKLKMRDKKKFYVPKHIKNPQPGDYEVTLNWGDKVYVEKREFEKKTSKFFKNYHVVEDNQGDNQGDNHDYSQDYLTIVSLEDNNEIEFTSWTGGQSIPFATPYSVTINVSIDNGQTWSQHTSSFTTDVIATLNTGDKVLIKGSNNSYAKTSAPAFRNHFTSTKNINIEGNIMSLLYNDNFSEQVVLTSTYVFMGLFERCSNLINAQNLILPTITLTNSCYQSMFSDCTSLTTAPELPATALTDYCYNGMFYNCTSLTSAPELPAMTLVWNCYSGMFANCTSLTTAPELPAIELASDCYSHMFQNCSNLNYIKAMFTTDPTLYVYDWVSGVAATGTFIKNGAAEWNVTGVNGIPEGWTVIEV